VKRSLARLSIPLREPFATAGGVVAERELLLLRLEDTDGAVGFGEAAPLEPYDGVTIEEVLAALRHRDRHRDGGGPPQARAAEEMARLDLEASRAGRAIGEPGAEVIPVNRTLAGGPPAEVAERAAQGVREGYSCFKVKVGLPDDEDRVAAVREAVGPWPALRIDANGAWSPEQAVETITRLARFDLQLVEQPCATLDEMAAVRREVDVPIAADESVSTPADVRLAAEREACDIVNVKLAPSGGFSAARSALREAAAHGLGAFLSSTLDGPWGISAALQLAAGERVQLACGLATLELFDATLALALPPPSDGVLVVPQGPGLGLAIDDAAIAEVLVEDLGE
jgi:o-succinylbenzoate synthase